MGMFENRCSLTGVSLWLNEAVLVLLERGSAGAYSPVTLGVKGSSNSYGSIDSIAEDFNVRAIARFVKARFQAREVTIAEAHFHPQGKSAAQDVELFFRACERNTSAPPARSQGPEKTGNGLVNRPLRTALVARVIWDDMAQAAAPLEDVEVAFVRIFGQEDIPREIYGTALSAVQTQIAEQAAVTDFMAKREIDWTPSEISGQDGPDQVRQYLVEAQQKYARSPEMRAVLSRYEAFMEDAVAAFDAESDA